MANQKRVNSSSFSPFVTQRQKKSLKELKQFAAISKDWGDFLIYAGDGPYDDWELDKIWNKYGPDDSSVEEIDMDETIEFDHQFSDGPEGEPVYEEIPSKAIVGDNLKLDNYEGGLGKLIDDGLIQTKSYGKQSTNTYIRKGKKYKVTYDRTAKGSINFGTWKSVSPLNGGVWSSPETSHKQKIIINVKGTDWIDIVTKGKKIYKWKGNEKNRSLHFRAANIKEGVSGSGQPSAGVTWHHQESPRGQMVGVEHEVHKRHGHNGGVALW